MDIEKNYCKHPYFFTTGVMESWSFFFVVAHLAHVGNVFFLMWNIQNFKLS